MIDLTKQTTNVQGYTLGYWSGETQEEYNVETCYYCKVDPTHFVGMFEDSEGNIEHSCMDCETIEPTIEVSVTIEVTKKPVFNAICLAKSTESNMVAHTVDSYGFTYTYWNCKHHGSTHVQLINTISNNGQHKNIVGSCVACSDEWAYSIGLKRRTNQVINEPLQAIPSYSLHLPTYSNAALLQTIEDCTADSIWYMNHNNNYKLAITHIEENNDIVRMCNQLLQERRYLTLSKPTYQVWVNSVGDDNDQTLYDLIVLSPSIEATQTYLEERLKQEYPNEDLMIEGNDESVTCLWYGEIYEHQAECHTWIDEHGDPQVECYCVGTPYHDDYNLLSVHTSLYEAYQATSSYHGMFRAIHIGVPNPEDASWLLQERVNNECNGKLYLAA